MRDVAGCIRGSSGCGACGCPRGGTAIRLGGRTALVTGSGRAIALRSVREGADVVINYSRSEVEAAEVLAGVEAAGRRGFAVRADLVLRGIVIRPS